MNTHRIACLELDERCLARDLQAALAFDFNDSYSEFFCGEWRSCMLWNGSGEVADTHLKDYSGAARITAYGRRMDYVRELLEASFDLSQLRFARLVKLCPNSVIIPHRDYLELGEALRRVHLPLQTDSSCFSAQERTVYHMAAGEIWFIDATKVHSAASFSQRDRLHVILDFAQGSEIAPLLRVPTSTEQVIPAASLIPRPELDAQDHSALMALGQVIDEDNYRDILALLIRRYFRKAFDAASIFDRMVDMARQAGKRTLADTLSRHRDYYLVAR
jgi:L-proline cis-4-hydroxylase